MEVTLSCACNCTVTRPAGIPLRKQPKATIRNTNSSCILTSNFGATLIGIQRSTTSRVSEVNKFPATRGSIQGSDGDIRESIEVSGGVQNLLDNRHPEYSGA